MWFVYIIKSKSHDFRYLGSTNDLRRRFREHNDGESQSTKAFAPFALEAYIAVNDDKHARRLEKYFKTGSGKVILKKRILGDEASA